MPEFLSSIHFLLQDGVMGFWSPKYSYVCTNLNLLCNEYFAYVFKEYCFLSNLVVLVVLWASTVSLAVACLLDLVTKVGYLSLA